MPHLFLEYSANLPTVKRELLNELHLKLAEFETFKIQDMKSRAIPHEVFCLAEGNENRAFVHLQLAIMPGRSAELLRDASQKLHEYLKAYFLPLSKGLVCSFSVEVRELAKDSYMKFTVE